MLGDAHFLRADQGQIGAVAYLNIGADISENAEIIIIGAGVAGASMAITLARRGVSVLVLEKSLVHVDRIRGESLVPWGVLRKHGR